jgi:hypothetical protein
MKKKLIFTLVAALTILLLPAALLLADTQTYSGVMVDNLCISKGKGIDGTDLSGDGAQPAKHSVRCLKMPPCTSSGFSIYVEKSSGGFDIYKLDKMGNDLAAKLLKKTKKTDNYVVSVAGTLSGDVLTVDSIKEAN